MKQTHAHQPKRYVYSLRLFPLCLVLAALVLAAAPAHAGDNEWTALGPYGLGLVRTLVFDPQSSATMYLLTDDGRGLYKSVDGGASWSPANKGLPVEPGGYLYVGALTVDPKTPATVYASVDGFGIYKSTDSGASWSSANKGLPVEPGGYHYVGILTVDQKTPATVYASSGEFGIYKSSDGGASWFPANKGLPVEPDGYLYVDALAVDPKTPATVYVSVSGFGIYRSSDGGESWSQANKGLPVEPDGYLYVGTLIVDPNSPATVYASADGFGIYKSTDSGESWSPANKGLPVEPGGYLYVGTLTVDPNTPATVYANVGGSGIYKSTDGGASWSPANKGLPVEPGGYLYVRALTLDPGTPTTLYASVGEFHTLFKSIDDGQSWSRASFGGIQGLSVTSLAVSPRDAKTMYAGVWGDGIFRSMDGGNSWQIVSPVELGYNVRSLAIDPQTPSTIYAAMGRGLFRSTDAGDTWLPYAIDLSAEAGEFLVIDPQTPTTLYVAGSLGIFKTVDDGDTWILANSGLPQDEYYLGISSADNTTAGTDQPADEDSYGFPTLRDFVVNSQAPATLYTIAANRGIYKSTDAGKSWQAASSGLPAPANSLYGPSPEYFELTIDAQAPNNLYVAVTEYDEPDCPMCTHLYKSANGGESWSLVSLSLAPSDTDYFLWLSYDPWLYSLAVDGRTASLLYAATGSQFLHSVDGGQSWYAFGQWSPASFGGFSVVPAADPDAPGRLFLAGEQGVHSADLSATLTVEVIPLGTPPADDWTFTDPTGEIILPAAGGKQDLGRLPVGVRNIQMTPQANFTPRASCTHGIGSDSAWEAHLVAGADVRCRFFNIGDDAPHVFLPALSR